MTDEPLIAALMSAKDTLSRGGAIEAIRIVREHDRRHDSDRDPDWPRNPDGAEATKEIERLERACAAWAETSQANYQRAKKAEAEAARLLSEFGQYIYLSTSKAAPITVGGREYRQCLIPHSAIRDARAALKGGYGE